MNVDTALLERLRASAVYRLIGCTPLTSLDLLSAEMGTRIYAKCEGFNPGGSIKDRAAASIVERAILDGQIHAGTTIVESSSGNMGVALAQLCAVLRLRFVCVVDPKTPNATRDLLVSYGASVVSIDQPDPVTGEYLPLRLARVRQLCAGMSDVYWPDQYSNHSAPLAHLRSTLPEILQALPGAPDFLFVGVSTAGTLHGCQQFMRERRLSTKLVAVDAYGSVVFDEPHPGPRRLPGLGAAVRTSLAAETAPDLVVRVSDDECRRGCASVREHEGLSVGASSGGLISAIGQLVTSGTVRPNDVCVALMADRGDRYGAALFDAPSKVPPVGRTRTRESALR